MALIIDVETTGLPKCDNLSFGQLPSYEDLSSYEGARVVQVSMMLCNEHFEEIEFNDYVVKADFIIGNSSFHGITNEISETNGTLFSKIAEKISVYLKQVSHIVAHNANFDISIINSELYRLGLYSIIDEINAKRILCTMKHTKMIVKARNKKQFIKYPSLAELYSYVFNKNIENAHNSKYDVINLHSIVKNMYDAKQLNFNDNIVYAPQMITKEILENNDEDKNKIITEGKAIETLI
jgi:DNA polymerase III epsilon subunit-like protein